MNQPNSTNSNQCRTPSPWSRSAEHNPSTLDQSKRSTPPSPHNNRLGKETSMPSQPDQYNVPKSQFSQQQRRPGNQTVNGARTPEQQRYRAPHQPQANDTHQKTHSSTPPKPNTTDDDELLKSMEALTTNDTTDTMTDDDAILECTAKPLKMNTVETMFEKYESMRGGCRYQSIDETTILVIFGHFSTAKRAWIETRDKSAVMVRVYKGPMDIIEDIPIVRKSAMNHRPRPNNRVAQRLIHGSLGLKPPSSGNSTVKR